MRRGATADVGIVDLLGRPAAAATAGSCAHLDVCLDSFGARLAEGFRIASAAYRSDRRAAKDIPGNATNRKTVTASYPFRADCIQSLLAGDALWTETDMVHRIIGESAPGTTRMTAAEMFGSLPDLLSLFRRVPLNQNACL